MYLDILIEIAYFQARVSNLAIHLKNCVYKASSPFFIQLDQKALAATYAVPILLSPASREIKHFHS